jgi:HSP20 family protein
MALVHRDLRRIDWPTAVFPERWRRWLDTDVEQDGWLRVEEFHDGDTLVLRAEIPGVDPEKDVDVSLSNGVLTVRAHREAKEEHRTKTGFRSEFRYGEFSRSLRVPEGAGAADVTASYSDGILEVRVPVPPESEAEATRIAVTHA